MTRVALAAVLLLVTLAVPGPASATLPGSNGMIAFEVGDDGSGRLMPELRGPPAVWVMNPDGSGKRPLTDSSSLNRDPAWSPDGRRIAFTSDRDGDADIWVINVDGSGLGQLTDSPGLDADPTWSSDGRIAFTSTRDGNSEIYLMSDDGSNPTNVTRHPALDQQADWSRDGRLAFESDRDGDLEIYTTRADGSGLTAVTRNTVPDADASWSPSGDQIALARGVSPALDIVIAEADGGGETPSGSNNAGGRGIDHFPAWSPDGRLMATAQGYSEIVLRRPVDDRPLYDADPAQDYGPPPLSVGVDPAWGALPEAVDEPTPAETATVVPARSEDVGKVLVRLKDASQFVRLEEEGVEIPLGSELNTRRAAVTLQTSGPGGVQGRFDGGLFVANQTPGGGYTDIRLTGIRTRRHCSPRRRGAATTAVSLGRVWNRLKGRVQGRCRVFSSHFRAISRATTWVIEERCRASALRVLDGTMIVRRRGGRVVVRRGCRYVAPPGVRRCGR
jgi:hypothetical protein